MFYRSWTGLSRRGERRPKFESDELRSGIIKLDDFDPFLNNITTDAVEAYLHRIEAAGLSQQVRS